MLWTVFSYWENGKVGLGPESTIGILLHWRITLHLVWAWSWSSFGLRLAGSQTLFLMLLLCSFPDILSQVPLNPDSLFKTVLNSQDQPWLLSQCLWYRPVSHLTALFSVHFLSLGRLEPLCDVPCILGSLRSQAHTYISACAADPTVFLFEFFFLQRISLIPLLSAPYLSLKSQWCFPCSFSFPSAWGCASCDTSFGHNSDIYLSFVIYLPRLLKWLIV